MKIIFIFKILFLFYLFVSFNKKLLFILIRLFFNFNLLFASFNKFQIILFLFLESSPFIHNTSTWKQDGIIVAGGNQDGDQLNQLSGPQGIYVDDDNQSIYIADHFNNRIVRWKYDAKTGEVVAGGNGKGNRMDQLNGPTDVIVDKKNNSLMICDHGNKRVIRWSLENNKNQQIIISDISCSGLAIDNNRDIYVCDSVKNEVRRWKIGDENGTIVAGGNGLGYNLNQLDYPSFIFVDQDYSVYISDNNNHRVMKWMKGASEGIVVVDEQGQANSLTLFHYPGGVIVDHLGNIYVAEHCFCSNNALLKRIKRA